MSKFTDIRDAAEKWFANGWHVIASALLPAAAQLGKAEIANVLTAVKAAQDSGADHQGMADAAKGAALDTLKTIGVSVALDELTHLGTLALAHMATSDAPSAQ